MPTWNGAVKVPRYDEGVGRVRGRCRGLISTDNGRTLFACLGEIWQLSFDRAGQRTSQRCEFFGATGSNPLRQSYLNQPFLDFPHSVDRSQLEFLQATSVAPTRLSLEYLSSLQSTSNNTSVDLNQLQKGVVVFPTIQPGSLLETNLIRNQPRPLLPGLRLLPNPFRRSPLLPKQPPPFRPSTRSTQSPKTSLS